MSEMRQKIIVTVEQNLFKQIMSRATDEGQSVSDLIQDALASYLKESVPKPRERDTAYQIFCDKPLKLSRSQFRQILEKDPWGT